MQSAAEKDNNYIRPLVSVLVGMIIIVLTCPFNIFSENPQQASPVVTDSVARQRPVKPNRPVRPQRRPTNPANELPDSILIGQPLTQPSMVVLDSVSSVSYTHLTLPTIRLV